MTWSRILTSSSTSLSSVSYIYFDMDSATPTIPVDNSSVSSLNTPSAKRVVLRIAPIPGHPYEDNKYLEFINSFLQHCGRWEPSVSYPQQHYAHIEGCSTTHSWHIVLDMDKHLFSGSDFDKLPHEVYKVTRRESAL